MQKNKNEIEEQQSISICYSFTLHTYVYYFHVQFHAQKDYVPAILVKGYRFVEHIFIVCVFFHFIHLLLLLWRRRCQWQMPPWRNAWPFPMQLINDRLEFSHFSFLFLPHSLRSICHLFA